MRLKQARRNRKLTQAALAQKVGAHKITISRLERGDRHPSMDMLQRLATVLKVHITDLLGSPPRKEALAMHKSFTGFRDRGITLQPVAEGALLTIERALDPELYDLIVQRAKRRGCSPEQWILDRLTDAQARFEAAQRRRRRTPGGTRR